MQHVDGRDHHQVPDSVGEFRVERDERLQLVSATYSASSASGHPTWSASLTAPHEPSTLQTASRAYRSGMCQLPTISTVSAAAIPFPCLTGRRDRDSCPAGSAIGERTEPLD